MTRQTYDELIELIDKNIENLKDERDKITQSILNLWKLSAFLKLEKHKEYREDE